APRGDQVRLTSYPALCEEIPALSAAATLIGAMERTEQPPWLPPAAPPPPYEEQRKSLGQRLLGPIVAAGVVLAKFGKVALLLLTKAKFLTTSLSMLVSVAAYSLIWGWRFAAGFVALLFVHEMGHCVRMPRAGVR